VNKLITSLAILAAFSVSPFAQTDPCSQSAKLSQTASGVKTYSSNSNGNQNLGGSGDLNFGYEMWTEGGNNNKLVWFGPDQGGGMAFRTEWNNPNDYLGRIGFFWNKTGKKWDQYKEIYADFNYTRSANGTGGNYSYIGIYGWTLNPQMEWYIIDDWFGSGQLGPATFCNNNCNPLATFEMDGGTYNVYTFTRPAGSGNILGDNQPFPQIFSIRQGMQSSRRQCGTYSITEHFREWAKIDAIKSYIGTNTYEAKFLAEAGGGAGWLELSYLKMTQEDTPRGIPANNFVVVTEASPFSGGTVSKDPPNLYYTAGTEVTLTATPSSGWKFDGWEGDASGTNATTKIIVNAKKNVTAKFSLSADNDINLVKDGNFSGTSLSSSWSLNIGQYYGESQAQANVSGGKATINISNATAKSWEPQLTQYDIELMQGMSYVLTFKASAASARTMEVSIQRAVDPWDDYARDTIDLTTSEQTYTMEFTMTKKSDPASQLSFNLGGKAGNMPSVTISDVSLRYKITDTPSSSSGGSSSSSDGNLPIKISPLFKTQFQVFSLSNKSLLVESNFAATIYLYNTKGNMVQKIKVPAGSSIVNLSVPSGIYIVKNAGNKQTQRVMVK